MPKFYLAIAVSFVALCATTLVVSLIFSAKHVDGGAWPLIFCIHVLLNIGYIFSIGVLVKRKKYRSMLILLSTSITATLIFCMETYSLMNFGALHVIVDACGPYRVFMHSGGSIYVAYAIFPIGICVFNTLNIQSNNVAG